MSKVEFLFLSEEDLVEAGVLDAKKCVDTIEEVFRLLGEKDYIMGGPRENSHGSQLWFPKEKRTENMPVAGPDRRFMSMNAYLGGKYNITGQKWYGSNVANKEKGLPRSVLMITLNDADTGAPFAYMSANLISATRTGAVPAVATKYLASKEAHTLAIIGAGVISWSSTLAILEANKNIKQVNIFDINEQQAEKFSNNLKKEHDVETVISSSLEDAVKEADVINVAASGAVRPEIKEDYLKDGSLLLLSGEANLSDDFILNNTVVMDNWEMHKETGEEWEEWEYLQSGTEGVSKDLNYGIGGQVFRLVKEEKLNEKSITDLGDVVSGKKEGRKDEKEKIVFLAGGMAVEDISWGYELYQSAKEKNLGQSLKVWDQPFWS